MYNEVSDELLGVKIEEIYNYGVSVLTMAVTVGVLYLGWKMVKRSFSNDARNTFS